MREKIMVCLFVLLLIGERGGAQVLPQSESTHRMGLEKVVQTALENNAEIKKAGLDSRAAAYQRKEVLGSGLPQAKAYGNYNNFIDIFPQAIPGGLFDPTQDPGSINVVNFGVPQSVKGGVEVTQLLFSQSFLVGLKAAKSSQEYYHLLSLQTEEDVIYDVVLNYYRVKAAELQAGNLQSNLERLEKLSSIVKAQVDNDLARKVDLNRIKVNMTTLETQLDNIEISVEQGTNYLKLLMGMPMEDELELEELEFDIEKNMLPIDLSYADLSGRYDLRVLEKAQDLQGLETQRIKSGYYPTLAAFFDMNYNAFSTDFDFLNRCHNWYRGTLFGLQLNVPLFDGNQRRNKVAQAKLNSQKLELDKKTLHQAAMSEYLTASKKMDNSLKGLFAQMDNLRLSEEVMDQTEQLYKEGLSPLTDLLDAELSLREARSSYFNQTVNVKTAQADLLKSTGRIRELAK